MTTNDKTGGPAFPVTPTDKSGQIAPTECGMTLLDDFAAHVAQGLLANPVWAEKAGPSDGISRLFRSQISQASFLIAQDLLAERERVMKELNQ